MEATCATPSFVAAKKKTPEEGAQPDPPPFTVRLDKADIDALTAWAEEIQAGTYASTVTKSSLVRTLVRDALAKRRAEREAAALAASAAPARRSRAK